MTAEIEVLKRRFGDFLRALPDDLLGDFLPMVDAAPVERALEPKTLPCLGLLDRIATTAPAAAKPLVAQLAGSRPLLRWGQTYTAADFGQHFVDNYGWVELIGTRGHFISDEVAAGFMILGPQVHYPDHHHVAEEIYIPLTGGTEWRKGEGGYVARDALEIIHHPSDVNHAMRTADAPLLALYLWRGGPLAQRSVITG